MFFVCTGKFKTWLWGQPTPRIQARKHPNHPIHPWITESEKHKLALLVARKAAAGPPPPAPLRPGAPGTPSTLAAPAAAPAGPVNLDQIPGLDDFESGGGLGVNKGVSGQQPPAGEGGGLLGGLTGGLTGGLQAGLGGLTGAASGGIGKLGDIGGSATGAASNLLSGGKGLFKKFGF